MKLRSVGRPRVLILGADGETFALLEEWLVADGIEAIKGSVAAADGSGAAGASARGESPDIQPSPPFDVVLVDIAFPRDRGVALLRTIADEHPGTPLVALSSGFFANVDCCGPCARQLGVAGVLPKPVAREALLAALRNLFPVPR